MLKRRPQLYQNSRDLVILFSPKNTYLSFHKLLPLAPGLSDPFSKGQICIAEGFVQKHPSLQRIHIPPLYFLYQFHILAVPHSQPIKKVRRTEHIYLPPVTTPVPELMLLLILPPVCYPPKTGRGFSFFVIHTVLIRM